MWLKRVAILSFLAMILCCLNVHAEPAKKTTRVVFFSFNTNDAGSYAVLKDGLKGMLLSRLAAKQGVVLLENTLTSAEQENFSVLSQEKKKEYFKKLETEYIAVGKMHAQDRVFLLQIDFFRENQIKPVSVTMHADNEQQIIEGLDVLAERIFEEALGHKSSTQQKSIVQNTNAGIEAFQTEHPDKKYKEEIISGSAMVDGDSNFEIVQADLIRRKSELPHGIVSMVVRDGDGDGVDEIFVASTSDLRIFHYDKGVLKQVANFVFKPALNIHAVNVADLDNDGNVEIYVSAQQDESEIFSSSVLIWKPNQGIEQKIKNIHWAIRPIEIPGEGLLLAGQARDRGRLKGNFLEPQIYSLKMDEISRRYSHGKKLYLPENVNLFDFVIADIDGDGQFETVAITRKMKLAVYDNENSLVWLSKGEYGGSITHLGQRWQQEEGTSRATGRGDDENLQDLSYVPTRLIPIDVNKDGTMDIIMGKNTLSSYRWLSNLRSFSGGNVVCMGWDGSRMVEMWGTDKLGGYVADYHISENNSSDNMKINSSNESVENNLKLYIGQVPNDSFANLFTIGGKEANLLAYEFNIIQKNKVVSESQK